MKKIFAGLLLLTSVGAFAQAKPAVKKPVPTVAALKTLNDSASYAIGISVANFYKQQGMTTMNAALVAKAISDVMGNKTAQLSEADANNAIMKCMNMVQESKAKPNIAAGEKFLADNKSKPGIKTTASGLQYEVLQEGSGPKPTINDTVTVNYVGTLIDGTEFDNSYKRGQPISFPVGGVIKGWTEALQLMPQGSKYKLYIPYQLAYGANEVGSIPAGSVLVFEVELLKVNGG